MVCANLEAANLKGANFEVSVNLHICSLFLQFMHLCVNMTLQDPAGSRANLEGVNLKGAVLEGSIMAGINLRVATLKNVNMQNCDLRMAVLVSGLLVLTTSKLDPSLFCRLELTWRIATSLEATYTKPI